ncbi:MAG TPA: ParB/RepB/Spo0J family partition protein [Pseudolabrys sp.]|jgi:ParB family chromosome partitioning protein|nr:ParB/RepB/Spo0J family partition protein [Pseudolabrys sp.]
MAEHHSRLGRGLASLIGDVGDESTTPAEQGGRKPRRAPIESLRPNPRNPRKLFTEAELDALASSIKERGIIQPIVVRAVPEERDSYEIIAGERRWRAAQRIGLHDVPIAVVDATDAQSLEFAIIENVQRADLNPLEEAAGYVALMEQCNHTQEEVAHIVGKSRPHIANTIRLLKLSPQVQTLVRSGKLSAGHARLLVGQPNQIEIAQEIIAKELSVRQLEEEMRADGARQAREVRREFRGPVIPTRGKDADTRALEKRLSDALGLDVSVDHKASGGGTLHIKYKDLDQLDAVLRKLGGDP